MLRRKLLFLQFCRLLNVSCYAFINVYFYFLRMMFLGIFSLPQKTNSERNQSFVRKKHGENHLVNDFWRLFAPETLCFGNIIQRKIILFLPFFSFQYSVWNVLWIGWNAFIVCFYLSVGILDRVSRMKTFIVSETLASA